MFSFTVALRMNGACAANATDPLSVTGGPLTCAAKP